MRALCLLLFASTSAELCAAGTWSAAGPDGGDARAFASVPGQPGHLYLGTVTGWIYESTDDGALWRRLARLDASGGLILDNIVVDSSNPSVIYVGTWRAGGSGGGLWVSRDSGKSWSELPGMHGQSIRALAAAPSAPNVLVAGTLEGVYRSDDNGNTWKQISPPGSREIHEVESIAIDPKDPNIVYAGTWHLPWKTSDGGKSWHNIKKGLIDDSDVFSIVIDPVHPRIVYLSACSGIYKSESAGELFHKIQGIPSTARRTRVLMQDPSHRETVYAGTTEGLYKTLDAGRTFRRTTGPDVIVNDVFVDPANPKHVLLATDRGGVLVSEDGGEQFAQANAGFSARKVEALLVDRNNPEHLFAGVVNDKEYGGVFTSTNGGATWEQLAAGLEDRDVFALAQAADGTIVAGTSHGIFLLQPAQKTADGGDPPAQWAPRNIIQNTLVKAAVETLHGKRIDIEKTVKDKVRELDARVAALDLTGDTWLAATSAGLFTSRDRGDTWQGGPVMGSGDYLSVCVSGKTMAASQPNGAVISQDGGLTWLPLRIPAMLTRVHRVAFSADGTIWIGAREGVYFSRDKGKDWFWVERLPFRDVDDLWYDAQLDKVLVSSRSSDQIFSIDPKALDWKFWQTGFPIAEVRVAGQRLLAASLYDGVVMEPETGSAEAGSK